MEFLFSESFFNRPPVVVGVKSYGMGYRFPKPNATFSTVIMAFSAPKVAFGF